MGNVLPPVSGTILVVDQSDPTEDDNEPTRSGPRFPRPQYQRLETTPGSRLARGSSPPPVTDEIDFDDAVTQVNTPRPKTGEPRPTTAS